MQSPLILTRAQVRRVDAQAIDRYGMSGLVLMENAGRGVVDVLLKCDATQRERAMPLAGPPRGPGGIPEGAALRLAPNLESGVPTVAILCGKGNNAGDGFVIARHLDIHGVAVKAILLAPPDALAGDARRNYEILTHTDVPIVALSASADSLPALLDQHAGGAGWLVDAMLGAGATGEPREPLATAIRWMNAPTRSAAGGRPSQRPRRRYGPLGRRHGAGRRHLHVRGDETGISASCRPALRRPAPRRLDWRPAATGARGDGGLK